MAVDSETSGDIELVLEALQDGPPGITPNFGRALAEAASVCLDEQGHSSPTPMQVCGTVERNAKITWQTPSDRAHGCWGDPEYTTEHGAYGVASLLIPEISEYTVVERSKKGTGFDFWLGDKNDQGFLFQNKARLEVSGIRKGSDSIIADRVRSKLQQTERSSGTGLPAVVVVVEFGDPQSRLAMK